MTPITLHQALLARHGSEDVRWLGQSAEFDEAWKPRVEAICRDFGPRRGSVRCPLAVLAQPVAKGVITVVQAADLGPAGEEPPVSVGFRFLVLTEPDYYAAGGDPFAIAAALPAPWYDRGSLPKLEWTPASTRRTVEQVCDVLKRPDGTMLLGAAQAVVDGSRIAWVRPQPDAELVGSLWTLLPTSVRCELYPASFAFSNALRFDAVIVPELDRGEFDRRYLSEEQADNYPEGRYELALQSAAEAGDQVWLDSLLSRRSRREVWRLGWWLLAALVVLTLAVELLRLLSK